MAGSPIFCEWIHPTNGREQWVVRIFGSSKPFLFWLQETSKRLWLVGGALHEHVDSTGKRHPRYILKFGKIAAKVILAECCSRGALALRRKAAVAEQCIGSHVGWSKSKTVSDTSRWENWSYLHIFSRGSYRQQTHDENIDPTAGLLGESIPRWRAGVMERQTLGA